ncbi:hypothetical protein ACFLX3_02195 [Chloroflexota bacterium]
MAVKTKTKTIEFVEQDEGFIKKLAEDIGCYYFKANEHTYNLKKFASNIHSKMGVFAWVHKEDSDCFWISTRKIWVEEARAKAMAGRKASGTNSFARDTQQAEDSVSFNVQDGYEKTVSALRLINKRH